MENVCHNIAILHQDFGRATHSRAAVRNVGVPAQPAAPTKLQRSGFVLGASYQNLSRLSLKPGLQPTPDLDYTEALKR